MEAAPASAPTEWEDLELVIATIPNLPVQVERRDFYYLRTLGKILPGLYQPLCDAFREGRYTGTLDEAAKIHNERMARYIEEMRQRGVEPKILQH